MRICLLQNPWQLSFRGKWTWDDIYNDPRGMSGSELGFVEIAKGLAGLDHEVWMFTDSEPHVLIPNRCVMSWDRLGGNNGKFDLAIAINHPGGLEHFDCPKLMLQWLNSHEYCSRAEYEQVDLFLSPSEAHREFILSTGKHELADAVVDCDPAKWSVLPLGCTPSLYDGIEKVPGRVIYASSPDRGLHHLLQAWPAIKRAAPHAHLKIYYRILPWIAEMKAIPEPFPPCEENRQRALFIEEALRRLSDPKWGVEVVGPVSRNAIARAMGEAECLAYPCDTLRWSEGFSCTTLEALAAGARPVIWDCDALGSVYARSGAAVIERGNLDAFTDAVVRTLKGPDTEQWFEDNFTKNFVASHTWRNVCSSLLEKTRGLTEPAASSPSDSASTETTTAPSPT